MPLKTSVGQIKQFHTFALFGLLKRVNQLFVYFFLAQIFSPEVFQHFRFFMGKLLCYNGTSFFQMKNQACYIDTMILFPSMESFTSPVDSSIFKTVDSVALLEIVPYRVNGSSVAPLNTTSTLYHRES